MCTTLANVLHGGAEMTTRVVKVDRGKSEKFGAKLNSKGRLFTITEVTPDGALARHNAVGNSSERIYIGESISKVNDQEDVRQILKKTTKASLALEVRSSPLPRWLWFMHSPGDPYVMERLLTSPGWWRVFRNFRYIGGVGFFCWFLSGYPPASLPMYFFLSGGLSLYTTKACHDDQVHRNVPHCYRGGAKIEIILKKVWRRTQEVMEAVQKSPWNFFFRLPS